MRVQLLEIYNEQLRDLLDAQRTGKRLDIRNTERSGLNVPDAIQVPNQDAAPCVEATSLASAPARVPAANTRRLAVAFCRAPVPSHQDLPATNRGQVNLCVP